MLNLAIGAIERCNVSTKIGYTEIGLLGLNEFSSLPVISIFSWLHCKTPKSISMLPSMPFPLVLLASAISWRVASSKSLGVTKCR